VGREGFLDDLVRQGQRLFWSATEPVYPAPEAQHLTGQRTELDDFAACKITRKED
jgi:hypothetical protein